MYKRQGIERISSNELSARMKVTASQIRQDLNNFGGFGQQGYGYNVKYLYTEIARILGIDRQHNLIIIGAGNLGQAIANYTKDVYKRQAISGPRSFPGNTGLTARTTAAASFPAARPHLDRTAKIL